MNFHHAVASSEENFGWEIDVVSNKPSNETSYETF